MSKHKIVLIVLIVALSLTSCNGGRSVDGDNTTTTGVSQSTNTEVDKVENETKVIDTSENGTAEECSVSEESIVTMPSDEGTGSEEVTTEISLEGSTSEGTEGSTKPSSPSGSTSVKTTEATTKVPTTTKAQSVTTKPVQPTTAEPKPTEAPTVAPKPTEAPTQAPTAAPKPTQAPTEAPTEAPKPAYNPDYVIAETTRQLKAAGYIHIPEHLDNELSQGLITKEHYDRVYPTAGVGWFEVGCWERGMDENIYELVESCKYLCVDNMFYIEYIGLDRDGYPIYRVYR